MQFPGSAIEAARGDRSAWPTSERESRLRPPQLRRSGMAAWSRSDRPAPFATKPAAGQRLRTPRPVACEAGPVALNGGQGRLAQSVERLVYTEDVGGSSPSPPTNPSQHTNQAGSIHSAWTRPSPPRPMPHCREPRTNCASSISTPSSPTRRKPSDCKPPFASSEPPDSAPGYDAGCGSEAWPTK